MNPGPHLLGRRPSEPDPRDVPLAAFLHTGAPVELGLGASVEVAVRAALAAAPAPPSPSRTVRWVDARPTLDQGQTNHCVGFGWSQWGNTRPVGDNYAAAFAHDLYYECKVIDGEAHQENGSAVRSGAKAMKNRGRLAAYAFAASADEVRAWVRAHGPVVMGTDWYNGMFRPDGAGRVYPTGKVEGGHCYLLLGDSPHEGEAICLNSWGPTWGLGGRFRVAWSTVERLLGQGGEGCAAIELPA